MRRRLALLIVLGAALGGPARAERAPAARPPRRPALAIRPSAEQPAPNAQGAAGPGPGGATMPRRPGAFEPAPVPNRALEAPRAAPQEGPSLSPGIIQRRLPGRGQAAEGSPDRTEDRLFEPAPGARLRVPFSY